MKLIRTATVPAAAAVTAVLALGVAGPAAAHVTATPTSTAPGDYTVVSFSVGHGCDGSPTTEVAIQLPESVYAATPTRHPYYEVEKVMEQLDEPPTDAHGNEVTERVDRIVYTADTPLPDGERDAFELSLQIPEDATGQLVFPTVQTCEQGETAWTEVAEEGAAEPEHPAPAFAVGAAAGTTASTVDASEESDTSAVQPSQTEEASGNGLALAGLVAGMLGLVLGAIALARTRRA